MYGNGIALAAWALLLVACRAPEQAPAVQEPTFPALTGRVVDQADLLTSNDEARLSSELAALEDRTTDQFVVVTVRSLNGQSIEQFSRALGNQWGIGQADKDNGVLLVVAPSERTIRIEVGYGLEPILTDDRARTIVERDLIPHFREQRWSQGIFSGSQAIIATLIEHEREPRRGQP